MIRVEVHGVQAAARGVQRDAKRIHISANKDMRDFGQTLLADVKGRATHRPGPQVITGRHLASIKARVRDDVVEVYSDSEYAEALEYGHSGTDWRGNPIVVKPFPHFRPAIESVGPKLIAFLRAKYGG